MWEVPLLRVLRQQPEGHEQFDPLWTVQGQRGRNGKINHIGDNLTLGVRIDQFEAEV